ncbi:hypothetical protein H312_01366 [Anncaliia algerae PRA339]|uniref:Reverse transcriptase domain-containing protein n=1 Tax=Anncaliia algerae PRA339 TaxID=1288291 RepID=A0A059F207_9MICR|nr:hypothetical protein H312_01366 [Anncaliia algerae PRA339]
MEKGVKMAELHARDNNYVYNTKKCALLSRKEDLVIKLNNTEIPRTKTFTYLGMETDLTGMNLTLQRQKNWKSTVAVWQKLIQTGVWNQKKLLPSIRVNIIKTFLRPRVEFGMNLGVFDNRSSLLTLQRNMNMLIRSALGIGRTAKVEYFHWLAGMEMTEARCLRTLKKFLNKVRNLGENNLLWKNIESYPSRIPSRKRIGLNVMLNIMRDLNPQTRKLL